MAGSRPPAPRGTRTRRPSLPPWPAAWASPPAPQRPPPRAGGCLPVATRGPAPAPQRPRGRRWRWRRSWRRRPRRRWAGQPGGAPPPPAPLAPPAPGCRWRQGPARVTAHDGRRQADKPDTAGLRGGGRDESHIAMPSPIKNETPEQTIFYRPPGTVYEISGARPDPERCGERSGKPAASRTVK